MKKEYYQAYEDLYEEYHILQAEFERSRYFLTLQRRLWDRDRLIRVVIDACERAMSRTETRDYMRPDAKHLLLINLHQMIALPMAMSGDTSRAELDFILKNDAEAIINAARNRSTDQEISGHSIISAIAEIWGELKSTRLQIWG